eukprot:6353697-Ditylum_brightwellii.AAC.1
MAVSKSEGNAQTGDVGEGQLKGVVKDHFVCGLCSLENPDEKPCLLLNKYNSIKQERTEQHVQNNEING